MNMSKGGAKLGHVSLGVSNVARAEKFYDEFFGLLGFRKVPIRNRHMIGYRKAHVAFWVNAFHPKRDGPLRPHIATTNGWVSDHLGFWIPSVEQLKKLEQELIDRGFKPLYRLDREATGFPFSQEPSWYFSNAWSDPDNNVLELYTLTKRKREKKIPKKERKKI